MRSGSGPATTVRMMDVVRFVAWLVARVVRRRAALVAENALLRQQLIAAQRKIRGRVRWTPWERLTMGLAARLAPAWRTAVLLVQPATVLRWHRAWFRAVATTFSAAGSTSHGAGRAHPRDCDKQSPLGPSGSVGSCSSSASSSSRPFPCSAGSTTITAAPPNAWTVKVATKGGSEGTSRRSVVVLEHVVAFRKTRSGSTKSHSDSSRSGIDWTKSRSYFDEPSAERGNRRSPKRERPIVFQERRIVNDKPFIIFEE